SSSLRLSCPKGNRRSSASGPFSGQSAASGLASWAASQVAAHVVDRCRSSMSRTGSWRAKAYEVDVSQACYVFLAREFHMILHASVVRFVAHRANRSARRGPDARQMLFARQKPLSLPSWRGRDHGTYHVREPLPCVSLSPVRHMIQRFTCLSSWELY